MPDAAQLPAGTTLKVEGALRPVLPPDMPDGMPDWPDSAAKPFQDALAAIVNAPGQAERRPLRMPTRCWRRRSTGDGTPRVRTVAAQRRRTGSTS